MKGSFSPAVCVLREQLRESFSRPGCIFAPLREIFLQCVHAFTKGYQSPLVVVARSPGFGEDPKNATYSFRFVGRTAHQHQRGIEVGHD
jgi:hypothetical protein